MGKILVRVVWLVFTFVLLVLLVEAGYWFWLEKKPPVRSSPIFRGVIYEVKENSLQVKNDKGEIKEFILNPQSLYFVLDKKTVGGKPQKITDGKERLKVGQTVNVAYEMEKEGKLSVVSFLLEND